MTHLFFAHSNITLLFAQAIATSLPVEDRKVVWLEATDSNIHARESYQLHLLPEIWSETRFSDFSGRITLPAGRALARRPLDILRQLKGSVRELEEALSVEEKNANGAMQLWVAHRSKGYTHTARWCSQRGFPTHFYEEGTATYLDVAPKSGNDSSDAQRFDPVENLRKAMLRASGLGQLLRPIEPLLTDIWLNYPQISTQFSAQLPQCDMSPHFDAQYIARLLQKPQLNTQVMQAAANYPSEPYALFVSSVEVEDNFVHADDYFEAVAACRSLPQIAGLPFVIKPHPRNRPDVLARLKSSLDARIVKEEVSVSLEILASRLNCALVLGVCSSPLIYLPLLYGTATASLAPRLSQARLGHNGGRIRQFAQQFADVTATV